jgi:L-seryl-tRNA(Ser) seleniumtransferase
VGGGAAPDAEVKTWVIAVASKSASAESILTALRKSRPPIIARISEDRVLIDLRTVAPEEESLVERALSEATEPDRPE